jgi:chemotaxis signal transduction protein
LTRQHRRKHRPQGQPVILFVVGECVFAIAASAVTEIQGLQDLKPIESQLARFGKVHNTVVRDGRRYWVVDANLHFQMQASQSSRVLLLAESPVAVKVDSIVRMAEIGRLLPLPQSFQGDERNWYLGLALIDTNVVPVVNPGSFLSHYGLNELEMSVDVPLAAEQAAGATA